MANSATNALAVELDHDDLIVMGREFLADQQGFPPVVPEDEPLTLRLDDLLQDANGEVVLFNDSGFPVLALDAGAGVTGEGQSGPHVTAAGDDVSGFRYVSFDNGLTLYYQDGLDLIVRSEPT